MNILIYAVVKVSKRFLAGMSVAHAEITQDARRAIVTTLVRSKILIMVDAEYIYLSVSHDTSTRCSLVEHFFI